MKNNVEYELVNQFGDVVKTTSNPKEISDILSDTEYSNPYKSTVVVYKNGIYENMFRAMKFITFKF